MKKLSLVSVVLFLILSNIFGFVQRASATQTTGGVNWIDPLSYTKPQFIPITVPDEANVANKYYVDFTNGSGSVCSESSPCKAISSVYGKPGTTGGPAYIYLKGSGRLDITGTLYGTVGNEIVLKPWPGASNLVTMTSAGSSSWESSANIVKSGNVHHVIIDGGPDMLFDFRGSGPSTDQNNYTLVISSNYITLARSRIHAIGGYGPTIGVGTGAGTYDHIWLINNEVYDSTHYYGAYTGGGTGCADGNTSHSYVYFINNIFRDICGRGIQIEPRSSGKYTYIDGNAFHNVGYGSCLGQVSSAVQPASACGGSISDIYVRNNIMFDLGGGGVGLVGSFQNTYIYNNTIYDYAKSNPLSTNSHGIGCYADGCPATVKDNIILYTAASGINPINRGSAFSTSTNLCEPGKSCGNASKAATRDTVFVSYDKNNPSFLRLQENSTAIDGGVSLFSTGLTLDYAGTPRPSSGAFDIGAFEYKIGSITLTAPQDLKIE